MTPVIQTQSEAEGRQLEVVILWNNFLIKDKFRGNVNEPCKINSITYLIQTDTCTFKNTRLYAVCSAVKINIITIDKIVHDRYALRWD